MVGSFGVSVIFFVFFLHSHGTFLRGGLPKYKRIYNLVNLICSSHLDFFHHFGECQHAAKAAIYQTISEEQCRDPAAALLKSSGVFPTVLEKHARKQCPRSAEEGYKRQRQKRSFPITVAFSCSASTASKWRQPRRPPRKASDGMRRADDISHLVATLRTQFMLANAWFT